MKAGAASDWTYLDGEWWLASAVGRSARLRRFWNGRWLAQANGEVKVFDELGPAQTWCESLVDDGAVPAAARGG